MKTIRDFDLNNKKVIIRVDFNVPIKDGIIKDDNRIVSSLKTINYAIDNNAKVILMSHLGRVKTTEDLKNTLLPVSERLSELLNKEVKFINKTRGLELEEAINNLNNGDVLLMENTRFEDLEGKKESSNDEELGNYWASLGDIFINDAFGTSHRAHASNVGIASKLESGIGFLIEEELNALLPAINTPNRPFTVILGGSKVSDKIGLIENLVKIADYILIGGAMAFTFIKSKGISIGESLHEDEYLEFCKNILENNKEKIILPIDVVTENNTCSIDGIKENEKGFDIGPLSVELFKKYLNNSNTIIWNGPLGMFEEEKYSYGTKGVCDVLSTLSAVKIAGGGDTASYINNNGYESIFTHISTGGGASLELLEGKELPGISVIK
ncbi:MAG: phosphoglycerate kinase [Firmicutes bacterium]|nr:phosphoglycerate kinase [Bacillota bacterium]